MKNKEKTEKDGFTLIELLVVIAILSVLAVAVTLILNPAELVRQGRDSTRLSDFAAVQSAVAIYLSEVSGASFSDGNIYCTSGTVDHGGNSCLESSSTAVDGSGWVAVDLDAISGGSPLSVLPMDPVNDSDFFYAFHAETASTTYEINAAMESNKFSNGGSEDVESTDGGDTNDAYEVGNHSDLDLM